jgi:N-methylhydantoinase A
VLFAQLVGEQDAAFGRTGIDPAGVTYARSVAMRYVGQFHELVVDVGQGELDEAGRASLETDFHRRHDELYGYSLPWRSVEILECHLRGSVPQAAADAREPDGSVQRSLDEALSGKRDCRIDGASQSVPVYGRELLEHGHFFPGPALVDSAASTVYVPEAFDARVEGSGDLILTVRSGQAEREPAMAGEARA